MFMAHRERIAFVKHAGMKRGSISSPEENKHPKNFNCTVPGSAEAREEGSYINPCNTLGKVCIKGIGLTVVKVCLKIADKVTGPKWRELLDEPWQILLERIVMVK